MKILAVIPARGGSKGVPRKNIRQVAGRPLIAWTIEQAHQSKYITQTILSSDDQEIIRVARQWNCEVPFVRPAEYSRDDTSGIWPVVHALDRIPDCDYVVLLQPTSPLRSVEDIDRCISLCVESGAPAAVTMTAAEESPYWMYSIDGDKVKPVVSAEIGLNLFRRQTLPTAYLLNGAVYVAKADWFYKTRAFMSDETMAYIMPKERSLDIDTEDDLQKAHSVLMDGLYQMVC